jgi:hypothetical protein
MKKQKSKNKLLADRCYELWRQIIYLRSGEKSELSGKSARNAHHVRGKSTNALRYDIRNGINLTISEHVFGIHSHDPFTNKNYHEAIDEYIIKREGKDIFDTFMLEKNIKSKTNLAMTELYLKAQLKALQAKI